MAQYAATVNSCRHLQLLAHMGAPLSSLQPCIDACDNCLSSHHWKEIDVTATARNIVDFFRSKPVRNAGGVTNVDLIVNTLRGSQGEKVLHIADKLGYLFGVARKVPKETVQTVLGLLLARGIIRGDPVQKNGPPQWNMRLRFAVSGFYYLLGYLLTGSAWESFT